METLIRGAVLLCLTCGTALESGQEKNYWQHTSVVYAKIVAVKKSASPGGKYLVDLRVRATLTGSFDAARAPDINARGQFGIDFSSSQEVPRSGGYALVVLRYNPASKDYEIPFGFQKYMPRQVSVVDVTGFDDPKVMQLEETLAKLRGKSAD